MTRETIRQKYQRKGAELQSLNALVDGAALCRDVLNDLELVWAQEDEAQLTLAEAAEESGYSADHLRRLVRDGRLPCRRIGKRLHFRSGDLPRKVREVDAGPVLAYDPVADARQVVARRNHGAKHGTNTAA